MGTKYIFGIIIVAVLITAIAALITSQPSVVYIAPKVQFEENATGTPDNIAAATGTIQQIQNEEPEEPAEIPGAFVIKTIKYTLGAPTGKTRPLTVYLAYENPTTNEAGDEWQIDVSVSGVCKTKIVPAICKSLSGRNLQTTKRGYDYRPTGGMFVFSFEIPDTETGEQSVVLEIMDNISGRKNNKSFLFDIQR